MNPASCKNCGFKYKGNFCPRCGQSAHEQRIDAKYILHDVPHSVFHIDNGFFYTLKSLFTRPGAMIQDFLEGKRAKYFRPLAYVVLMSAISTLIVKGIEWFMSKSAHQMIERSGESFFEHYFSLFIFIMIPFASLITWITFIKKKYNYWEHFIANTYIAAQLNIMLVLVNLVSLIIVLFIGKYSGVDIGIFISIFMSGFLYLYGSAFGYIFGPAMKGKYKLLKITLRLTLMNCFLFVLYFTGFNLAGIMKL